MIPETKSVLSACMNLVTSAERRIITSATILAQMTSKVPVTFSVRSPQNKVKWFSTPLSAAFSWAVRTATSSISTPTASFAPKRSAVIARIPEPVPMSRTREPLTAVFSKSCMQRRVVSCVPVPKAMPGSRTIGISSGIQPYCSQQGTTTSLSPTFVGW